MLRVHKLIEQIARGKFELAYEPLPGAAPEVNVRIPGFLAPILEAHKFALHYDVVGHDALRDTPLALWRSNILKPPFPVTWWEIEMPNSKYVEGLLVKFDDERQRTTIDIFQCWNGEWIDLGVQSSIDLLRNPVEAAEIIFEGKHFCSVEQIKDLAIYSVHYLTIACCVLSSNGALVTVEEAPSRLNAKRERQGKSPLFEHRTITVPGAANSGNDTGTHSSPRLHWRRGHIRTLSSGVMASVRPCLVGLAERGIISKDYVLALIGEGK